MLTTLPYASWAGERSERVRGRAIVVFMEAWFHFFAAEDLLAVRVDHAQARRPTGKDRAEGVAGAPPRRGSRRRASAVAQTGRTASSAPAYLGRTPLRSIVIGVARASGWGESKTMIAGRERIRHQGPD